MTQTLTIQDETALGKVLQKILISVQQEVITVEELIRLRVTQEVVSYNTQLSTTFNGLIEPNQQEIILNKKPTNEKRQIDIQKQIEIALRAFNDNGFFILVDNRQVDTLDEELLLDESTIVSFIKLTPLIGG